MCVPPVEGGGGGPCLGGPSGTGTGASLFRPPGSPTGEPPPGARLPAVVAGRGFPPPHQRIFSACEEPRRVPAHDHAPSPAGLCRGDDGQPAREIPGGVCSWAGPAGALRGPEEANDSGVDHLHWGHPTQDPPGPCYRPPHLYRRPFLQQAQPRRAGRASSSHTHKLWSRSQGPSLWANPGHVSREADGREQPGRPRALRGLGSRPTRSGCGSRRGDRRRGTTASCSPPTAQREASTESQEGFRGRGESQVKTRQRPHEDRPWGVWGGRLTPRVFQRRPHPRPQAAPGPRPSPPLPAPPGVSLCPEHPQCRGPPPAKDRLTKREDCQEALGTRVVANRSRHIRSVTALPPHAAQIFFCVSVALLTS